MEDEEPRGEGIEGGYDDMDEEECVPATRKGHELLCHYTYKRLSLYNAVHGKPHCLMK